MDTSGVEVLGEVHVRKRKRQSQPSQLVTKSKRKRQGTIAFDIPSCGAFIQFKNPATADRCLQQNNHTICGKVCEVKRAKATKYEKKQLREAIQKNVPTPQAPSGHSTATARITLNITAPCEAPNESNSVTVSGFNLISFGTQCAAKIKEYFKEFGKVISVTLISDSEATVIFRDSTSVEKCLQTGTLKIGDRECKVTKSSVPKSTTRRVRNRKKKMPIPSLAHVPSYPWQENTGGKNLEMSDPRLPYHAGFQTRNEKLYVMPNESNSVTVSGLALKSLGAQRAAKVELISDSEATIIFRDSTSVEKCLQTGTMKIGNRECKVTRSPVPKSTTVSGMNRKKNAETSALAPVPPYPWQQNTDPGLPYYAGFQTRNETPLNDDNFNADLNWFEESWGQSTSFGSFSYPTYSGAHLAYNSSFSLQNEMPYYGHAMLSFNGNDNPAPGPLTSYYRPTYGSDY
ncbi:hypothetical protein Ddc_12438 [Ditylenchus destructor]|nr:hypothetical protein Ddc_12438 [Ditylenchus destructor]